MFSVTWITTLAVFNLMYIGSQSLIWNDNIDILDRYNPYDFSDKSTRNQKNYFETTIHLIDINSPDPKNMMNEGVMYLQKCAIDSTQTRKVIDTDVNTTVLRNLGRYQSIAFIAIIDILSRCEVLSTRATQNVSGFVEDSDVWIKDISECTDCCQYYSGNSNDPYNYTINSLNYNPHQQSLTIDTLSTRTDRHSHKYVISKLTMNSKHYVEPDLSPLLSNIITAIIIHTTLSEPQTCILWPFVLFTAVRSEQICSMIDKAGCYMDSSVSNDDFCCEFVEHYSVIKDIEVAMFIIQCFIIAVVLMWLFGLASKEQDNGYDFPDEVVWGCHGCIICMLFVDICLVFAVLGIMDQGKTINRFENNNCILNMSGVADYHLHYLNHSNHSTDFTTYSPTQIPTDTPTKAPTKTPTTNPTKAPSKTPTSNPTEYSQNATNDSSNVQSPDYSTEAPTQFPIYPYNYTSTEAPTAPTQNPTQAPTQPPTYDNPSENVSQSLNVIFDSAITIAVLGCVLLFFCIVIFIDSCQKGTIDMSPMMQALLGFSIFLVIGIFITMAVSLFGFFMYTWNDYVVDADNLCYEYIAAPTASPTPSPTSSAPTLSPTAEALFEMIDLEGSFLCNDLSSNIYSTDGINFNQCKSLCVYDYAGDCAMINYVNTDCYLFDEQCVIVMDDNINNLISFAVVRSDCVNYPFDWMDKEGNQCSSYISDTDNGSYSLIEPYCADAESLENRKTGISATESCCECNGGIIEIDEMFIHFTNSTSLDIDRYCEWDPIETSNHIYRQWDNMYLYFMCAKLNVRLNMNIDFNPIAVSDYDENMDFVLCDFNDYQMLNGTGDLYFTFIIEEGITNTMYINTYWYNLNQQFVATSSSVQNKGYFECLSSITSESLYISYPCMNVNNDTQTPVYVGPKSICTFDSTKCMFDSSDSIFCCQYISADNPFVNDSALTFDTKSSQQNVLKSIERIKNISITAVIITSIFIFWMILLALISKCITINELEIDLNTLPQFFGYLSAFIALLNFGIAITIITMFYSNKLGHHLYILYENSCFSEDSLWDIFRSHNQTTVMIGMIWTFLTISLLQLIFFAVFIIAKKMDKTDLLLKSNVLHLILSITNYIILIINCGIILSLWNKYLDLYNDDGALCYTSSISISYLTDDTFGALWIVLIVMTSLIICGSMTFIYLFVTEENFKLDQDSASRYLTLLAVLISAMSSVGSVALTNALGLSSVENGTVALFTAICALSFASIKITISFTSIKGTDDRQKYLQNTKAIALFVSTLTDATFDFFQGIAAMSYQKYSSSVFVVLIVSTWVGVIDELIECIVEIFVETCKADACCASLDFIFLGWSIVEAAMGIFILGTYDDIGLMVSGIFVEVIIIILSIGFIGSFIKKRCKND